MLFHRATQVDTTRISANWDFMGDPCPIDTYDWTVHGVDGSVVRDIQMFQGGKHEHNMARHII